MAFVVQAGSVAAALASIVGLVVFFVPSLTPGKDGGSSERVVTVVMSNGEKIKLAIPKDGVPAPITYGGYLDLEENGSRGVPPSEKAVHGVDVHYRVAMPGYAKGAPFRTRFTVYDQAGTRTHRHVTDARLDADSDECRCTEFVPVPRSAKSYRVLVEVYRPGAPYAAPVVGQYTDWFVGSRPATG
jgi:hypothetical protein